MSYTFAFNGTAPQQRIAAVRDEIDDISGNTASNGGTIGTDYFLTDERITARFADALNELGAGVTESELRLWVAASCLDTLATNQAYVLKKQKTMSSETDGPAVGKEIRSHAAALRARVALSQKKRAETAEAAASTPYEPMGGAVPLVPTF